MTDPVVGVSRSTVDTEAETSTDFSRLKDKAFQLPGFEATRLNLHVIRGRADAVEAEVSGLVGGSGFVDSEPGVRKGDCGFCKDRPG
jgi:hypothetical protein